MGKLLKHLKTIRTHRKWVRKMCFKMGIPWQGIIHDLSKYSITELKIAKYYSGKKSPHQICRETIGCSPSWNHHYHKNKHHFQFWWDENEIGEIIPVKMPYKYVLESFCDMCGASMAYNADKTKSNNMYDWDPKLLLDYWNNKCKNKRIMNKTSMSFVEMLILKVNELKLPMFFKWYKHNKKALKTLYDIKGFDFSSIDL